MPPTDEHQTAFTMPSDLVGSLIRFPSDIEGGEDKLWRVRHVQTVDSGTEVVIEDPQTRELDTRDLDGAVVVADPPVIIVSKPPTEEAVKRLAELLSAQPSTRLVVWPGEAQEVPASPAYIESASALTWALGFPSNFDYTDISKARDVIDILRTEVLRLRELATVDLAEATAKLREEFNRHTPMGGSPAPMPRAGVSQVTVDGKPVPFKTAVVAIDHVQSGANCRCGNLWPCSALVAYTIDLNEPEEHRQTGPEFRQACTCGGEWPCEKASRVVIDDPSPTIATASIPYTDGDLAEVKPKRKKHYQTGADSCACGRLWPCEKLVG